MKTLKFILLSVFVGIAFGGPLDPLGSLNPLGFFSNQSTKQSDESLDKKWCGCQDPKAYTSHEHKNYVPWEVYILENLTKEILCTAIIVNNKDLIAAKDCLKENLANQISVALKSNFMDSYDRVDDFKTIEVEEIVPLIRTGDVETPSAKGMGTVNIQFFGELVVLKLKTPIEFSPKFFEPACINLEHKEMTDYENSDWKTSAFIQKEDKIVEHKDLSLNRMEIDKKLGINFLVDFDENPLVNEGLKVGNILRSVNGGFTKVEGIYFSNSNEEDNKEFANYGRLSSFSKSIKKLIGNKHC